MQEGRQKMPESVSLKCEQIVNNIFMRMRKAGSYVCYGDSFRRLFCEGNLRFRARACRLFLYMKRCLLRAQNAVKGNMTTIVYVKSAL